MTMTEDFDNFFSLDDFAVEVTYTPEGGSPSTILGIFDDEFIEGVGDGYVEVE